MNKADRIWIKLMDFGHNMGCHQMPERSFSFKGYQFPLCARCTGVLIGELAAVIGIIAGVRIKWRTIFLSVAAMGIDWSLQYTKIKQSTNRRRLLTGIPCGAALTFVYFYLIRAVLKIPGGRLKNDALSQKRSGPLTRTCVWAIISLDSAVLRDGRKDRCTD